jgi:hypothetical protein
MSGYRDDLTFVTMEGDFRSGVAIGSPRGCRGRTIRRLRRKPKDPDMRLVEQHPKRRFANL